MYKKILTIVISGLIASCFLYFAFKDLDFKNILKSLKNANYFWVLVSMIFAILAYYFRAMRWNFLLEPLNYKIKNESAFWSISFGYLMNFTIPRSGEVARSTALYKLEKVPIEKSFGTIITERLVDLICMIFLFILTLIFKFNAILEFYKQSNISINPLLIFTICILGILALVFYFKFKEKLKKYNIISKLINIIDGVFKGITSIFYLKHKYKFILFSLLIWLCDYISAYIICFALPETSGFSLADGLLIVVVGTLGMMVPASGGIGAFHFAIKLGIGALFLSQGLDYKKGTEVGLSLAFLSHTMQIVFTLVLGFISIPFITKNTK